MPEALTLQQIQERLLARFCEGFLTLKDLPTPDTFKDMNKAVLRIVQAIEKQESIILIGDYDVDGVMATTIVKSFFDAIDYPLTWVIPNRFEHGYGLSAKLMPHIEGHSLAITVDNGIAAVEAAALCKEKGIDLIITDHHLLPPTLPEAYAIIDQQQPECDFPYKEVCGAQIAWYLCAALNKTLNAQVKMMDMMDLVAVATIADVMPLRHINRVMVQAGLQVLAQTQRAAFRAFREHTEKTDFTAEDVAFTLSPLLNSAGRMEDAKYAVHFLLSNNIYDARIRLSKLLSFNELRKEEEARITKEAISQIDEQAGGVCVAVGSAWHEGVIGIVASRLADTAKRPAIVLTEDEEGMLKGSGRSYGQCDLFALLSYNRELFYKFGGHAAAVGLSLPAENLTKLRTVLNRHYKEKEDTYTYENEALLGELPFSEITFSLTSMLKQFEPFGEGNPKPLFMTREVTIEKIDRMGKQREHVRFLFQHQGIRHIGVLFRTQERFVEGSRATIYYRVNENHFRGNTTLQLMIESINI